MLMHRHNFTFTLPRNTPCYCAVRTYYRDIILCDKCRQSLAVSSVHLKTPAEHEAMNKVVVGCDECLEGGRNISSSFVECVE